MRAPRKKDWFTPSTERAMTEDLEARYAELQREMSSILQPVDTILVKLFIRKAICEAIIALDKAGEMEDLGGEFDKLPLTAQIRILELQNISLRIGVAHAQKLGILYTLN